MKQLVYIGYLCGLVIMCGAIGADHLAKRREQRAVAQYVHDHGCTFLQYFPGAEVWSPRETRMISKPGFKLYGCENPHQPIAITDDEVQP